MHGGSAPSKHVWRSAVLARCGRKSGFGHQPGISTGRLRDPQHQVVIGLGGDHAAKALARPVKQARVVFLGIAERALETGLARPGSINPLARRSDQSRGCRWRCGADIYDHTWSFTAGRISIGGTADATLYGTFTGSPNSAGWIFEAAYLPFSGGGPAFWPWLNFRIGLQFTHRNKFDGATTNIDGMGRNANDNNTFFAYIWTIF